jgi:hypothetical protein
MRRIATVFCATALLLGGAALALAAGVKAELAPTDAAPPDASGWVIVNRTPKGSVVQLQVRALALEAKHFLHVGDMGVPVGEFLTDDKGNGRLHVNRVEIEGPSVEVAVHDAEHTAILTAIVDLPEELP